MVTAGTLTPDTLKHFQPFQDLNEQQLLQLCDAVEVRALDRSEVLFHCGDVDTEEYFLVQGELSLVAADGHSRKIASSDEQACRQLSRLRPRQYTVKALASAVVIVIEGHLLKAFSAGEAVPEGFGIGVTEAVEEDHRPYAVLLQDFRTDLAKNRCILPSLPEVAIKVRQLLEDENSSADQIARVVNSDPAIAAKLIGAANSPVFHGSDNIDTTRNAIVRLGLATTRQLVVSYAMRDLFTSRSAVLQKYMHRVWLCSVEVAAIAYVLAQRVKGISETADEVMLAGLLNDVGVIAIVNYLEKNSIWLEQGIDIDDLISQLRADTGAEILCHWGFPESFVEVVRESEHWARHHDSSADIADIIQSAKLYTIMHNRSYLRKGSTLPAVNSVDALKKLKLGDMTPELTISIIAEAREQIEAAKQMLQM